MRSYQASLLSQRSSLEQQLAGIEAAIGALGGAPGYARASATRRVGRPRLTNATASPGAARARAGRPAGPRTRAGSLKENIVKVLRQSGKGMTIQQIATSVKASGYSTKSADLSKAVSNALPDLKTVRRVSRGVYRA